MMTRPDDRSPLTRVREDPLVCCTLDGVVTAFSSAAACMLGYEPSEVIGRGIELIVFVDGAESARDLLAEVAAGASATRPHARLRAKDGRPIDAALSVSPIFDEGGRVRGAAAVLRDAREHRALEEARARLAAIVDGSDDAIVSKTLDGVITSWNRGAERLFGYTADEAVGRSITLIIPAERIAEETEVLTRIRRGDTVSHFETVRVRKDGARVDISLTVSPVRDAAGTIIGASKIARDITERRRVERERAALLAETQRASKAKDELIAMLGHELRNPLAAIMSAIHLLDAVGSDADVARRARGVLRRQSRHLARMVDDLLDVGRMITGKIALDARPIDLGETVRAQVETLRSSGRFAQHEVTLRVEPAFVQADPMRIEQVVANLVGNSLRFTPPGGRICVSVTRESEEAALCVEDDGLGFDPALVPSLFELFAQAHGPGIDRSQGGLGIGLTLVRRISELHHGSVEAVSEGPGKGSRFTVRLPLLYLEERVGELPASTAPSGGGVRVLAVEDNDDAREMLASMLSASGYVVRTAADGLEGLEIAREFAPELLIIDIGLPMLDGYALCGRVRAHLGAAPYIVALTGYGGPDAVRRAHEAGFDLHLAKPARADELLALAERARQRMAD